MPTRLRGFVALAAIAVGSSLAHAGVNGYVMTVTATDGTNTASWTGQWLNWNGTGSWGWQSNWPAGGGPVLRDPNTNVVLGRVNRAEVGFVGDPVINQLFAVQALNTNTIFTIASAVLNFPLGTYTTYGSAQMGVTDTDGDGASVQGLLSGNNAFGWLCNGGYIGLGIQSFGAGPNASSNPQTVTIPSNVYPGAFSMQSVFSFALSANDIATGSSNYQKVPAPASGALLGLGALAAARRRRR